MKNLKARKGFTLIELIIVIVIIGILIGLGTMLYNNVTTDAEVNVAISNLKTIESAIVVQQAKSSGKLPNPSSTTNPIDPMDLVSDDTSTKPKDFTYTYTYVSGTPNTATLSVTYAGGNVFDLDGDGTVDSATMSINFTE